MSHIGDHYVIVNADWDATIAAGEGINFGFNANYGALQDLPSHYVLNGVSIAG